ncbi:hypothetical protein MASR2M69_01780 [Bacteroidota bacterium]
MNQKRDKLLSCILVIITISIIIFTYSCTNKKGALKSDGPEKVKVIDLESAIGTGKIVDLSDVAHEIRYVKLETNDSSLIGRFMSVFYENERIYVFSRWVLKVFDKDGKFLFKFDRKGRGPQEYIDVRQIRIMSGTGNIMVQTRSVDTLGKLIIYDKDGNYSYKIKLPYNNSMNPSKVIENDDNLFVAVVNPNFNDSIQQTAFVYDSLFNIINSIPNPSSIENKTGNNQFIKVSVNGITKNFAIFKSPDLYRFKDHIRILFYENDNIFSFDANLNYAPAFHINYGKYRNESSESNSTKSGKHISQETNYFIESEENLILQFNLNDYCQEPYEIAHSNKNGTSIFKYRDSYALYNKKTGSFTLMNQPAKNMLGFREDIKNGPPFLPTSISSDFQACALFTASQIIEYAQTNDVKGELKEIVKGLKDTDNPIVAIARMK